MARAEGFSRRKPQKMVRWKVYFHPTGYTQVCQRADVLHPTDRVFFDDKGVEEYRFRFRRTSWYGGIWRVYREVMTATCPIYDPTIYGLGELVEDGWRVERAEQRGAKVIYTFYRDMLDTVHKVEPNSREGK